MAEFDPKNITGEKFEIINIWMKNLNNSETPCMLCKNKNTGDFLLNTTCQAFKDSIIPLNIISGDTNHDKIFKGNAMRTNIFKNKWQEQPTDLTFELDNNLIAFNQFRKHEAIQVFKGISKERDIEIDNFFENILKKFVKVS